MTITASGRFYLLVGLLVALTLVGCRPPSGSGSGGGRKFLSLGTAPVGGAFPVVGGAIADVLNEHSGEANWRVQAKGTKGSQENIRRLQSGDLQLAMSNAAITYFGVRGEAGWERAYDVKSVMTLAPNVALFITRADSGIQRIADLKGKRVIVGPAGAGFEMFARPIVEEHGLAWNDFTSLPASQSAAVDMLGDGTADAALLGGAIPTASITQATSTFRVHFVPFDEDARQRLIEKYPFFYDATIPAGTYSGLTEDFVAMNVGSMHLITSADQDEQLIYELTKSLWENRAEITERHQAGRAINEQNAARPTGVDYHPGSIRFYKEIGIWPESSADSTSAPSSGSDEESEGEAEPTADSESLDAENADDVDATTPEE
jgi:uncharacterized protein